jgi:hypothetical protein
MKDDIMESRISLSNNPYKISDERLAFGSINDKYPVVLNDGRTVVYIVDKSKEPEIRLKYEMLRDKKYPTRCPRHQM